MKIYLLDRNPLMVAEWKKYFKNVRDVEVIYNDFEIFMETYDVECVVSPADSYGFMDGGYDLAITNYFGEALMEKVQRLIIKNCFGEQPVGTSMFLSIPNSDKKLIHTPTMRIPSEIKDPMVIYHCMRSTLTAAIKHEVNSIVIPAFGGYCGNVDFDIIAKLMREAYDQIKNPPRSLSWDYAYNRKIEELI